MTRNKTSEGLEAEYFFLSCSQVEICIMSFCVVGRGEAGGSR